jgi:hypothetical protein
MEVLPDRVIDSVLDEVHQTRQRAVFGLWRTRSMLRAVLSTAAVVALLVVGGALLYQRGNLDAAAPSPTAQASSSPSQPAVITATPAPTAEVLSLDLTWTEVDIDWEALPGGDERKPASWEVAWLADRFVQIDSDRPGQDHEVGSGAVLTSTDGTSWEVLPPGDPDPGYAELLYWRGSLVTWEDQMVGWWNPQDRGDITNNPISARDVLRIVQPPAVPTVTTPFEGRIQSIAVGPAGIVAETEFWPDESTRVDGVWFSPDGIEWTAIPTGLGEVVGVSDGFIARGVTPEDTCPLPDGCGSMWHSADGLTWRNLGHPDGEPESHTARLVPWMGGALLTDGVGVFDLWTSQGYSELPMAADFPAPADFRDPTYTPFATGPLGLVSIRLDSVEVLVTRDGVDWKLQPMPTAMAAVSDWWLAPTIVVGDRSILYQTWSGSYEEGYVASLWVGSIEP